MGESPKEGGPAVTDAALIRAALPGNTRKRLARLMGVSPNTAKHWLYSGPGRDRARELARVLLDEMDREDRTTRAAARRQLTVIAGGRE